MNIRNSRTLKLGGFGIIVTVVVLAIAILVNLAVNLLPSRMTKFSVSPQGIYDISEEGRTIAEAIKDDITVYLVCSDENMSGDNAITAEYIRKYAELNSRIRLKSVDPVLSPAFIGRYTDEELKSNVMNVIVENNSNGRSKVIPNSEIFYQQYSMEEIYYLSMMGYSNIDNPTYFGAEQALVTALDYVSMEKLPTLYYTTGHGESSLDTNLTAFIEDENIVYEELPLLTAGAVPEDADTVIINCPTKDFSADEIKALDTYWEKGGNLLLISYYDYKSSASDRNLTNLHGFAAARGLSYKDAWVFEGSTSNVMQSYYNILPVLADDDYSASINKGTYLLMGYQYPCHGITTAETAPEGITLSTLMTTTNKGYAKTEVDTSGSVAKAEEDEEGKFVLGARAESERSSLTWFSSAEICDSQTNGSFSNISYFMSVIADLCNKESSVSIAAKALQVEALSVSDSTAKVWGIVLIALVPVMTLAAGFVIWYRRTKR